MERQKGGGSDGLEDKKRRQSSWAKTGWGCRREKEFHESCFVGSLKFLTQPSSFLALCHIELSFQVLSSPAFLTLHPWSFTFVFACLHALCFAWLPLKYSDTLKVNKSNFHFSSFFGASATKAYCHGCRLNVSQYFDLVPINLLQCGSCLRLFTLPPVMKVINENTAGTKSIGRRQP